MLANVDELVRARRFSPDGYVRRCALDPCALELYRGSALSPALQRYRLVCGLLLVLGFGCGLAEAEQLRIAQLHKYHASYQLHSVTLVGTVRAMYVFPPLPVFNPDRCSPLYGIAQFELVDETGSLPVETLGTCFAAAAELPLDGDVIELTAMIQVFVPEGQREQVIKAVTQKIVVLKAAPRETPAP